jgi:hypothetical protein
LRKILEKSITQLKSDNAILKAVHDDASDLYKQRGTL